MRRSDASLEAEDTLSQRREQVRKARDRQKRADNAAEDVDEPASDATVAQALLKTAKTMN